LQRKKDTIMRSEQVDALDVWRGAVAGAIGGAVASSAMVLFNHLLGSTGFGQQDRGRRKQHRRTDAKPNETDGTTSDEPASEKVASNVAEAISGEALSDRERKIGGSIVHHAFGAAAGALYGAAAARMPALAAGGGLPYGALVWVAGPEVGLPLTGLSRRPSEYPPSRHVASLATHLVFGGTVEAVRRSMTRR
jgi:hypothetical protein